MAIRNIKDDFKHSKSTLDQIYRGVVEDRNDPKKLGRCKIRIMGVHTPVNTDYTTEGIPTNKLPWAEPALGLIEGSMSGFGLWSVPLQGSHVYVFFEGGHLLKPRYFATSAGIPQNNDLITKVMKIITEKAKTYSKNIQTASDEVMSEIEETKSSNITNVEYVKSGVLGQTSEQYESGGKGPGTISSGIGDYGGVSYGVYQFASYNGKKGNNCPVEIFRNSKIPSPYNRYFDNCTPGSNEYSNAWTRVNNELGETNFRELQHAYIKEQYYDIAVRLIYSATGINVNERCFGLQELVWSTSVQFGSTGCKNIFIKSSVSNSMNDSEIINSVYKEKSRTDSYFKSSSLNVRKSVNKRYMTERMLNLDSCNDPTSNTNEMSEDVLSMTEEDALNSSMTEEEYIKSSFAEYQSEQTLTSDDIGFKDPDGLYPKLTRLGESDYHRLSRGIDADTIVTHKNSLLDLNVVNADLSTWSEPKSYYNANYPDNIVLATHKGIVLELDNTDDNNRIHMFHPSNTYIEISNEGNVIDRTNNDKYEIIMNDSRKHIKGNEYETTEKNKQKHIKKNEKTLIIENQYETIKKNTDRKIGIDYTDNIGRNVDKTIGKNETRKIVKNFIETIGKNQEINIKENQTLNVDGNREKNIKGDDTTTINGTHKIEIDGTSTYIASTIHLNP